MQSNTPAVRDLLLVGGGHSHVQVLKHFAMNPVHGVRLTLVSDADVSPYSGMVPGYIAGHYALNDIHIPLEPLCRAAGARFIRATVMGLDVVNKELALRDRPGLRYDLLSINSGASPNLNGMAGIAVKPITQFLAHWPELKSAIQGRETPAVLGLVGAGAGGVEVAMACRASLPPDTQITLLGPQLLLGLSQRAKLLTKRSLERKRIEYVAQRVTGSVQSAEGYRLQSLDGAERRVDHVLWVTDVQAPDWLAASGLACDARGFPSVGADLRSISDTSVFVAGDAAHLQGQERAKAGVYAVRAAPVLAHNLALAVQGKPLTGASSRFKAQRSFLTLIGTGSVDEPDAIATKGPFALQGKLFWRLKDRIDRRFMARYCDLPDMTAAAEPVLPNLTSELAADLPEDLMRCGGCGAKLAADPLSRVLARLPDQAAEHVALGIGDDAAQVSHGSGSTLLSVDGFRAMIDDPYLLGRICAHHSLNDLFAMGATPTAALALATLPLMAQRMMEEDLFQLLSGAVDVLNAHGAPLVGGHSAEGAELSIALTVTGAPAEVTLTKSGGQVGDVLLLTKPLGTGVILAAAMRGMHLAGSVPACLAMMDTSNAVSLGVLQQYGVNALTDVTGFGLIGHLGEMLRASHCGVELRLTEVPILTGALELAQQGVRSSIQGANAQALSDFTVTASVKDSARLALLSDPQTSGGLLACIPSEHADACLRALQEVGIPASIIGSLLPQGRQVII